MLLLVATRQTQGLHPDDVFDGCVDGELVRPALCGTDENCAACNSRFAGIGSGGVTSTAVLVDVPLTRRQLLEVVRGYAVELWGAREADVRGLAKDLRWPGRRGWPVGAVLERDADLLTRRQ